MFRIILFYPKVNENSKLYLNIIFKKFHCVVYHAYALSANINQYRILLKIINFFFYFINCQMLHCFFMTYLDITFKNLTLNGSRCIFFKYKNKSSMEINQDNIFLYFFINYQMSHCFLQV